jgi:hypothetical protein
MAQEAMCVVAKLKPLPLPLHVEMAYKTVSRRHEPMVRQTVKSKDPGNFPTVPLHATAPD